MHIGLIGGIGPAATEFYYRGLVNAFADAGKRLELTIVNASTEDLLRNLTHDTPQDQAEIFLAFVERLKAGVGPAVACIGPGFLLGPSSRPKALVHRPTVLTTGEFAHHVRTRFPQAR